MQVRKIRTIKKRAIDMETIVTIIITNQTCSRCQWDQEAWEEETIIIAECTTVIQIKCIIIIHHQAHSIKDIRHRISNMECIIIKWVNLKADQVGCFHISSMECSKIIRDMETTRDITLKVVQINTWAIKDKIKDIMGILIRWECLILLTLSHSMEIETIIINSRKISISNKVMECSTKSHMDRAHNCLKPQTNTSKITF